MTTSNDTRDRAQLAALFESPRGADRREMARLRQELAAMTARAEAAEAWRAEWSDAIDEAAEACSAAEDRAEMAEVALGAAFRAGWSARHNHNRASPPDMARHLEAWKQQAFNDARRNTK